MSAFQPRTFGSTLYATLCALSEAARAFTDEERIAFVRRANEVQSRWAILHPDKTWAESLDDSWEGRYDSCFLFEHPKRRDFDHTTILNALTLVMDGCGMAEGTFSSWRRDADQPWSADGMFRQDCNAQLDDGRITWEGWKQAVAAARSGIVSFEPTDPHPIDRFRSLLIGLAPEAEEYPKWTVALLLEEWVRVHNSQPIARIGDRLRITRPVHDFATGTTVECVNVGASVIFVTPVENDSVDPYTRHYSLDRDMPAWEHLHPEPVTFIPNEIHDATPAEPMVSLTTEPDYKALYEQAQRDHQEDILLIERKFWVEAIERSWCSEAESVMRWLNDNGLHVNFDVDRDKYRPINRYLVKGYADVTITDTRGETWKCENHDFEISVTGTSETDALDTAGEEIDNDDVKEAVEALTTIAHRTVTVNSWEFHRAEMTEAGIEND